MYLIIEESDGGATRQARGRLLVCIYRPHIMGAQRGPILVTHSLSCYPIYNFQHWPMLLVQPLNHVGPYHWTNIDMQRLTDYLANVGSM